jgi:hypothetical protein
MAGILDTPIHQPPPVMLEPLTPEETFKHELGRTREQESSRHPLSEWHKRKFRQLQESVPGEVRSLLMDQLRGGFNTPETIEQAIPYGKSPGGFDPFTIRPQDLFNDPRSFNSLDRNKIKDILLRRELKA